MEIYRYLDTNFDGTGTKNAIGNYSGAVEAFGITPPSGEVYKITRMIVSVRDGNGFSAADYGNITNGLTNGISVYQVKGSLILNDLTDGVPIQTNAGWGTVCYDVDVKTWGVGEESLLVRWTFAKSGRPLTLGFGESLEVRLNDDLSDLSSHTFMVQGYKP